jgi:hypothetical protein
MPNDPGWATIPRAMLHDPDVPRDAKLVYLIISSHIGATQVAWPSHKAMAEALGMSRSQLKRQLLWLRENGYIMWTERRIPGREVQMTNEYRLTFNTPAESGGSHRTPSMDGGFSQDPLFIGGFTQDTPSDGGVLTDPGPAGTPGGSQVARERTSGNVSTTTEPRKRGTRLPDDWEPSAADLEWLGTEQLSRADAIRETDKFRDYWHAQPGQRGVKLDWSLTWRNWIRKAADDRRPRRPVTHATGRVVNRGW